MEDLQKFCKKHNIEMLYNTDLRHFRFSDEQGCTFSYYFYRTNDLRSKKELEDGAEFKHLIARLRTVFGIEEE